MREEAARKAADEEAKAREGDVVPGEDEPIPTPQEDMGHHASKSVWVCSIRRCQAKCSHPGPENSCPVC